MNIQELEAKVSETQIALNEVNKTYFDRKHELEAQMRAVLQAEFGATMNAAEKAFREARKAFEQEENRLRAEETAQNLPFPIGTILVLWSYQGGNSFSRDVVLTPYVKAVLQIYQTGDPPLGSKWCPARPGELVLRHLLKDGTPGKRGDRWVKSDNWYPEGVNPNKPK